MRQQRAGYLTTLMATVAAFPLSAMAGDMISPVHYGDELDRCINEVRHYLGQSEQTKIRHRVTNIHKRGAWYEFEILSQPYEAGAPGMVALSSECRANRFSSETVLTPKGQISGPVIANR